MAKLGNPGSSHVARSHVPERQPRPYSLPGLGSSHAPSFPGALGSDWLYLLVDARPEKGHAWGFSRPEAAFQVGVKTAGCFPGDKLFRAWGPRQQP